MDSPNTRRTANAHKSKSKRTDVRLKSIVWFDMISLLFFIDQRGEKWDTQPSIFKKFKRHWQLSKQKKGRKEKSNRLVRRTPRRKLSDLKHSRQKEVDSLLSLSFHIHFPVRFLSFLIRWNYQTHTQFWIGKFLGLIFLIFQCWLSLMRLFWFMWNPTRFFSPLGRDETPSQLHTHTHTNTDEWFGMVSFWKFVFISLKWFDLLDLLPPPHLFPKRNNSRQPPPVTKWNIRREQLAISVSTHMFPPSNFNLKKKRRRRKASVLPRNPCPVPSISF